MEEERIGSNSRHTDPSTLVELKSNNASNECQVCGVPGTIACFGAVVCPSCKMFFKRNAENKQVINYLMSGCPRSITI